MCIYTVGSVMGNMDNCLTGYWDVHITDHVVLQVVNSVITYIHTHMLMIEWIIVVIIVST